MSKLIYMRNPYDGSIQKVTLVKELSDDEFLIKEGNGKHCVITATSILDEDVYIKEKTKRIKKIIHNMNELAMSSAYADKFEIRYVDDDVDISNKDLLLSNYNMEHYEEYKNIIAEYRKEPNALDVYIRRDAFGYDGKLDKTSFALWTKDRAKSHAPFWDFFNERRSDG